MKEDRTSMTISLLRSDRKLLKKLALELDTTASALISRWLHEYLEKHAASAVGHEALAASDGTEG